MAEETSLRKRLFIFLLLRPPIIVVFLVIAFLLWAAMGSETTVDERVALSLSTKSPYRNTAKGSYRYAFAFCGDPHIRAEGDGCFPDLAEAIETEGIDFVIFGGDLTYLSTEHEYRNFVEHAAALPVPSYPALGNHDLYNNGWSYYWRYLGPSAYCFYGGNAKFVVIDSAGKEIGKQQMGWIRDELKSNRQPLLFVVSHVPILGGEHGGYDFPEGWERTELISLFEKYEVDCVLEGHYHGYVNLTRNGVRYITSGSFSEGSLDEGERHFLLFRVCGPEVTIQKVPVGSDIPVLYRTAEL